MAIVTMKQLLEAGVHFGHQTRRWNPKMAKFIFTERNGIYIVDLQKTVQLMKVAYDFIKDVVKAGESVLFVGTKKQAMESVREEATRLWYVLCYPALVRRNVDQLQNHPQADSPSEGA